MAEVYYPTWRYHKEREPVVVNDAEADEALGKGWADRPFADQADVDAPKDTRTEDQLVAEILEKGLSNLKAVTLKRKTKPELIAILEGK